MSEEQPVTPPESEETVEPQEPSASAAADDAAIDREMARKTRRSFLVGGIAALAGAGAWEWLGSRRPDDGVQWPLRIGLRANEQFWRDYFSKTRMAQTFGPDAVESPRENGDVGLDDDPDPQWKLTVDGIAGTEEPLSLSMADIQKLPKIEMITELKCIEGWSRVLKWGGVRFRDFVAKYAPGQTNPNSYVGLETPEREYYVGLDMASAMHPQTLLCYEMNGRAATFRTWRAATPGDPAQVRHQESQAHREDRVQQRAAAGLLGGAWIRLLRGILGLERFF